MHRDADVNDSALKQVIDYYNKQLNIIRANGYCYIANTVFLCLILFENVAFDKIIFLIYH